MAETRSAIRLSVLLVQFPLLLHRFRLLFDDVALLRLQVRHDDKSVFQFLARAFERPDPALVIVVSVLHRSSLLA